MHPFPGGGLQQHPAHTPAFFLQHPFDDEPAAFPPAAYEHPHAHQPGVPSYGYHTATFQVAAAPPPKGSSWKAAASAMYQLLKNPTALAEEFKHLQSVDSAVNRTVEEGNKAENRHRNRYHNVLPYDANRFRLQDRESYINASDVQIESHGLPPCRYICTQGPLTDTMAHFWDMLWQSGAAAVVMLTALSEGGVEKCAPYFPMDTNQALVAGEYMVRNTRTVALTADIQVRQLSITSAGLAATRKVYHIMYSGWPDDGVPQDTHGVRIMSALLQPWKAQQRTVVVHCSAGIGRTGTFCAIDTLLHRLRALAPSDLSEAEARRLLDVPTVVFQLRQQRMGMVQTPQQYVYCYLTLLEAAQHMALQADGA